MPLRLWHFSQCLCLLLVGLFLILMLGTFQPVAINQANAQSIGEEYVQRLLQITFSQMPATTEAGSVNIPGLGEIAWEAGQTPDQFLPLGVFYGSFNLQQFTMQQIANYTGINLSSMNLSDLSFLENQTLGSLVEMIPDLKDWSIYQVPLVKDLLVGVLNSSAAPWEELSLEQLIKQYDLADYALNEVDLSQYGLDAIPGLINTPIGRAQDWEKLLINQVPGLKDIPLSKTSGIPTGVGAVALFDMPYGKAEARRINTITGSDVEGFSVPCNKSSCPHIELSGPPWLLAQALHGKQWIVGGGKDGQKVNGGSGLLKYVNGGKEPTGRHPFGPGFKVVLEEVIESKGMGRFALYFRYCQALSGCSPYFIGPLPWFTNHEDDILFIGLNFTAQPPPGVPPPPALPPGTELPPGVIDPPAPVSPGEVDKDCETYKSVSIPALKQAIAAIESKSSGNYRAIGDYVCSNGLCGRALGKYQFMTYKEVAIASILTKPGGADFLKRANNPNNSTGYKQSLAEELLQYFPAVDQEAVFENYIKGVVDQAILEKQQGKINNIIERIGEIHNAGLGSSPGASPVYGKKTEDEYKKAELGIDAKCPEKGACEGRFIHPAPAFPVTDVFGWSPWRNRNHDGIDIGTPMGTNIKASDGGSVIFAGSYSGYGLTVDIQHCNGYVTRYAHLSSILVSNGQAIAQGEIVARSGATGKGTGPHLHFEIRKGQWGTTYDPKNFITF